MAVQQERYRQVIEELGGSATLIAVSKLKSAEEIKALYDLGQRDFGENYVQELVDKQAKLPADTRWHFIGHLQSNKVKFIAPFVHLIQGVDSINLLKEISRQGKKVNRVIDTLLQVQIAEEETKFGLNEEELEELLSQVVSNAAGAFGHIKVCGLMGMGSFSDDMEKVRREFARLRELYIRHESLSTINCQFSLLSMGMSGDYKLAISQGSNMVRIGSLLFGSRASQH